MSKINITEVCEKYIFIIYEKFGKYKKKYNVKDDKEDEVEYLEIDIEFYIEDKIKKNKHKDLKFLLKDRCFDKFITEYKLEKILNPPERCSICLEDLDKKKNICKLECKHKFHFNCIMQLYNSQGGFSNKCPECRREYAHQQNSVNRPSTINGIHDMSFEIMLRDGNPIANLIHNVTHLSDSQARFVNDIVQNMNGDPHQNQNSQNRDDPDYDPEEDIVLPPRRQYRRRINPDQYEYLEPGY